MGKKKFSSSGFAQPELDLPAARKFASLYESISVNGSRNGVNRIPN